jgi:hypothetical protein
LDGISNRMRCVNSTLIILTCEQMIHYIEPLRWPKTLTSILCAWCIKWTTARRPGHKTKAGDGQAFNGLKYYF